MFIANLQNPDLPVINSINDVNFDNMNRTVVEAVILIPSRFQNETRDLIPQMELDRVVADVQRELVELAGGIITSDVNYSGLFNNLIGTEALTSLTVWVPATEAAFSRLSTTATNMFQGLNHTSGMFIYDHRPVVLPLNV